LQIPEKNGSSSCEFANITASSESVMIILSIDWQASWHFESQVGGWKRILTNLFGNALKYTRSGFVHVSLRANVQITPGASGKMCVLLQIDDSGKGMSKEYLKHELYTPFAQEDPVSAGTGLGLSIVRQLITDLGGAIDIQSEIGYGTSVKVSVPLEPSLKAQEIASSSVSLKTRAKCEGFSLCLIGFDVFPDLSEPPTGILTVNARRMLALRSSITNFAVNWFGMQITMASSLDSAKGDILMVLRSQLNLSEKLTKTQPLIVYEDISTTNRSQDCGIFFLQQP